MDNGQPGSSERIINIKGLPNNIQVAQTLMQNKYVIVTVYYHYFIFILPVFDNSITSPCPDDLLFFSWTTMTSNYYCTSWYFSHIYELNYLDFFPVVVLTGAFTGLVTTPVYVAWEIRLM